MSTQTRLGSALAALALGMAALGTGACSGGAANEAQGASSGGHGGHGGGAEVASSSSAAGGADGGAHDGGGGDDGGGGAANDDGTPTRVACSETFGTAVSATFGRLDGYLVSIVPMGTHMCNGDNSHVHLQVKVGDAVYDVAVNEDVLIDEKDAPLPKGPWAEGWHTGIGFDYAKDMGLHSSSFTTTTPGALVQKVEGELANVNHISVFATGYGPAGVHDVHRQGANDDGAIVIDPLSPKAHLLLFRFSNQSF